MRIELVHGSAHCTDIRPRAGDDIGAQACIDIILHLGRNLLDLSLDFF